MNELSTPLLPYEADAPAAPLSDVDRLVLGRLGRLGIRSANPCSDGVFIRRVYLDVIGTLPTLEEARAFLQDRDPSKRAKVIDRLLEREEFADYWAMKWSDLLRVKSEFPINLWPNAVQAYHHWIRASIAANKPYDQFVTQMLTATGSCFRVPEVNFYRAVQSREPSTIAQAVALTFMGTRAENWPKERLAGMAVFFSRIEYKPTSEWKEEIVVCRHEAPTGSHSPSPVFPDGTPAGIGPDDDPREVFVRWLIKPRNPWFTRNIVNRVWGWLLGRGIVHEPDDIRSDNPPANPELLAYLERQLVAGHYDLKKIYRLILNSRTYQLSCIAHTDDAKAAANFACYRLRRLEAEVLIDAICQITGTSEKYTSPIPEPFTFIPEDQRSIALADGSITSSFLEMFGRPARDTGLESERTSNPTSGQRLHLLNSSDIQRRIERSPKLGSLLKARAGKREIVSQIYLTILSRYPTPDELETVAGYGQSTAKGRDMLADVIWSLINSDEFIYRH